MPESVPPGPVYSRLADRYQILSLIGQGGMASVYAAHDEFLDRDVAVKLFDAPLGDIAETVQHEHELQVLARLNHHSLVSLIDAGVARRTDPAKSRMFIVMELISGATLKTLIASGSLTSGDVAHIGFDVAEGLEYIHRHGVVHRDIKPANILTVSYGAEGARRRAKLADFGIALLVDGEAADAASTLGTSAYLSPEQAMRDDIGPSSDVYSLGLTLLECFTSTLAFPGSHLQAAVGRLTRDPVLPADLAAPWRELLLAMTAREPGDRPTSGESVVALGDLIGFERARRLDGGKGRALTAGRASRHSRAVLPPVEADPGLEHLATLAARVLGAPVAMVAVVEGDTAAVVAGPGAGEATADAASLRAIDAPRVFSDAAGDRRARVNAVVPRAGEVRFYAEAPLRSELGETVGVLFVVDYVAHAVSADVRELLAELAAVASSLLRRR